MGIGVGMAVPAVRRIVILSDPDRIGHNLGRLLAAEVGGFAAGPAVAALLVGPLGIPGPFLVIAGATVAALPFVDAQLAPRSSRPSRRARGVAAPGVRPAAASARSPAPSCSAARCG